MGKFLKNKTGREESGREKELRINPKIMPHVG